MRHLLSLSLLSRFAALSIFGMVGVGLLLTHAVARQVEARALQNVKDKAAAMAAALFGDSLAATDDLARMRPRQLDMLDRKVALTRAASTGLIRVKIFDGGSLRLVFSDDRAQIGRPANDAARMRRVLNGAVESVLVSGTRHDGRGERMLEVYLPLRLTQGESARGIFEVYLAYEPVARAITRDTRELQAAVVGGLLLLWLVLLRVVATASRRLRRHAEESSRQAREDGLTGLPNRRALREQVTSALDGAHSGALLLLDLDHFKDINDTLGHEHGDSVLRQVADRLRSTAADTTLLARLGGDEFVVFASGTIDETGARALAERVRAALDEPIDVAGMAVRVDASVGVALHPLHGATVGELLRHADVAMYAAKAGHDAVCVYDRTLDPYSRYRLRLAAELPDAIRAGQVVPYYQPIVRSGDAQVVAVEALARWHHPEHGVVAPVDFIPIAERTGAMALLTASILEQALRDAHRWQNAGLELGVACNLGAASAADARLPDLVADALRRWPVAPGRLTLELSEDTVISDPQRVGDVLSRLAALGVRLALDDFGTGNSSLGHLRRLPLHEVKIDRSFVQALSADPQGSLVPPILALAQSLGLESVAEGVEDADTADALMTRGCDRLQGFFFQRPVPAAELERWLADRIPAAVA